MPVGDGGGRRSRALRPCAECGGRGSRQALRQGDGQALTTIVCRSCGARTPVLPVGQAVAAWNRGETERRPLR